MKSSLALLLFLFPGCAFADVDCVTALSDPDINECASRDFDKVETRLNATYKKLLAELASQGAEFPDALDARSKLIEAQRLWVRFREADCNATFEYNKGGTIRQMMYIGCMSSHAELRIKQLEEFGS